MFGISVDSWYSHVAYHKQLGLPEKLRLLSDFNREVTPRYGILFDHPAGFNGVPRRTVFVIAPDGRVVYRWDNTDPPSIPAVQPVLEAVKAIGVPPTR